VRLLVVSQYFWPEDFRVNEVVSELTRRGHDVTVLTGKPNYPDGEFFPDYLQDPGMFATYAGARVVRVPMRPRGRGSIGLLLNYLSFAASAVSVGIFRLRGERFDAMFVSQYSPILVGIPAIALRRLKRVPIVFWILDLWPESLSAVGAVRSKVALRLVGRLAAYIYSRCDIILAPSRSMIRQIATYCEPAKRIEYFPNWTESAYVDAAADSAAEVTRKSGSFSVMFAGNIGEAQDFPTILDAAERLKSRADIRWLIVGDGRMAPWVRTVLSPRRCVTSDAQARTGVRDDLTWENPVLPRGGATRARYARWRRCRDHRRSPRGAHQPCGRCCGTCEQHCPPCRAFRGRAGLVGHERHRVRAA